jgi:inosine-uridine nucleoside N-ribohydrolase
LICLGPLSNIGEAIDKDPNIESKVRDVFILGGSYLGIGN